MSRMDIIQRLKDPPPGAMVLCGDALAYIDRLRTTLEEYACYGPKCPVEKLQDGSCIHAGTGQ